MKRGMTWAISRACSAILSAPTGRCVAYKSGRTTSGGLTVSLFAEVPGFSVLEPKRHIPYIADLDGAEIETFGPVMARVSGVLREVTNTEQVFVYVFREGIPHLHVHLAPHRKGDALNEMMVKGEIVEQKDLESGAGYYVSKEYPPLPEEELRVVAEQVHVRLAEW